MSREKIIEELNLIAKKDGMLKPERVVEYAKNPKTALHQCFTWDNTKAAEQWRLHQARMIIRVSVTVIAGDMEEIRAFVSLKADRYAHEGYRPIITILSNKDLKEQMLQDALEDMRVFKEKYNNLKELVEVFEAMDKVALRKVIRKSEKMPLISYQQLRV